MNIPHHGHVDNIPADWAVEMSCTLGRDGAKPTPRITHFDEKVLGLIYTIKGFEVAASRAAISGELNDVLLALNLSPLIHSDRDAEQLAREMILAHENGCRTLRRRSKTKIVTGVANGTRIDRQCRRLRPQ